MASRGSRIVLGGSGGSLRVRFSVRLEHARVGEIQFQEFPGLL